MINDTRFKWLTACIAITIIAVVAIWRFSEPKSEAVKTTDKTGDYVYLDKTGLLHTDRKCSRLNYKWMTSERIKVRDLPSLTIENNKICPKCVSDRQYEILFPDKAID